MSNCGMLPSTLVMLRPKLAVNRFPGLNLIEVISEIRVVGGTIPQIHPYWQAIR